ncbi:MAG: BatA domain-containing protein [Planctomycetaceae bacterium]|nr:BatA domain-containing protein [Planctomycetaceae bacterium]
MTFLWPVSLVALVAVAAAAVWALLRPARRQIVAPTLTLWQEAARSINRGARARRRVGAAWVLLLIGAAAAVLAMARPVYQDQTPARHVAMAVVPTAELGGAAAMDSLRRAAAAVLDRLDEHDRVQVVLPEVLGGASAWMDRAQARALIDRTPLLAVRADQVQLPAADDAAQHVYRLGAASAAPDAAGPQTTIIRIPAHLPPVTIDAVAAEPLAGKTAQVFVALRNQTAAPQTVRLDISDAQGNSVPGVSRTLAPSARQGVIIVCPQWEGVRAVVSAAAGPLRGPGASAYLARRSRARVRVAIVGDDSPLIRRYVSVDESLEPVADAAQADIVIANRLAPPPGKPALVIEPPQPPPLWRPGGAVENIALDKGSWAAGEAVMAGVSLAAVAVRRAAPWRSDTDAAGAVALASYNNSALIVRNEPQDPAQPRRVYVAFALEPTNTNFGATPAFVVFMANATRWLGGGGQGPGSYACLSGIDVPHARWKALAGGGGEQGPLLWPGFYRDEAGALQALCLLGLDASAEAAGDPVAAARAAPLPEPVASQQRRELWPPAAVAALVCWLAGWFVRHRMLGE